MQRVGAWQIAFGFLGSIVGAGFVSGREAFTFFSAQGGAGTLGVLLSVLVFAIVAPGVMMLFSEHGLTSYRELFSLGLGPFGARLLDGAVTIFLFVTLSVVLSAGTSLVSEIFGLPQVPAALAVTAVTALLATGGAGRLAPVQGAVFLWLLAALLLVFVFTARHTPHVPLTAPAGRPWWAAALLYPGYNLLLSSAYLPLLVSPNLSRREIRRGGVLGALMLGGFLLAVHAINARFGGEIASHPLPLLHAAQSVGPWLAAVYMAALGGGTLLSSPSYVLSVGRRFEADRKPLWLLLICLAALPLSSLGLIRLIELAYPLMGLVGMVFFGMLMVRARIGIS